MGTSSPTAKYISLFRHSSYDSRNSIPLLSHSPQHQRHLLSLQPHLLSSQTPFTPPQPPNNGFSNGSSPRRQDCSCHWCFVRHRQKHSIRIREDIAQEPQACPHSPSNRCSQAACRRDQEGGRRRRESPPSPTGHQPTRPSPILHLQPTAGFPSCRRTGQQRRPRQG